MLGIAALCLVAIALLTHLNCWLIRLPMACWHVVALALERVMHFCLCSDGVDPILAG